MRRASTKSKGPCAAAFTVAMVAFAGAATGESGWPTGLVVDWQAPPTCPDADQVRGAIVSVLSAPARSKTLENPTTFRARVAEASAGFRLEVQTMSAVVDETKTIEAQQCPLLVEALALVVAFAVDPAMAPSASPSETARPNDPVAPTPGRARPLDQAAPSSGSGAGMPLGIGPLASTSAGILPIPAFAFGGTIALGERPRWELEGRYWMARRADLSAESGPGAVDVSLLSGRFSACLPWSSDRRWAVCFGTEVGRMHGEGTFVTAPGRGDSWWAAVSAGLAARVPFGRHLDGRFRIDVGVPIFRPSFTIQHADVPRIVEGFRPAPVFAMLTFEPELTFFSTENTASGHP